jgi:membrane protease YdiL (CAAX protease family)
LNLFLTDHRVSKEKPWFDGGLYWNKTSLKHYTAGWVIGLLALAIMVGVGWLFGFYDIESVGYLSQNNASHHTTQLFQSSTSWYYSIFLFLLQMLAVGFYEEVLLRGYILINLKEGIWWEGMSEVTALFVAVIISSLMFSFAHLFNPNASMITFITISLAGFLLAFPFLWTANLALSIGLHSAWNFILGGIFGFKVSGLSPTASFVTIESIGPDWWTGGLFGPEAGLSGVLAMCLSLLLIIIFLQRPLGKVGIHSHWLNPAKRD